MSAAEPSWLIEARRHIGQAEIPGKAENPWIVSLWRAIKRGGIKSEDVPWCFTGDTEVMTETGWVRLDSMRDERVFQADDEGKLTLTHAIPVRKTFNGDVRKIQHRSINLTCDPGHKWYGQWGKNKSRVGFATLDDITADGLLIPPVRSAAAGLPLSDDQLALVAAFISDGKHRQGNSPDPARPWSIEFEVSKPRKITALSLFSPDHVYTQRTVYGPRTKTPLTVFRFDYPRFFDEVFEGYKRLRRSFVNGLSQRQCQVFLAAYAAFDGNDSATKTRLYVADRRTRDDLISIAVLAGFLPSVQEKSASELGSGVSWTVAFAPEKSGRHLRPSHVVSEAFDGFLYCVQVPHGRIVVRGPNGAPVLTGNCAAFVGACLEKVGIVSTRFESAASYMDWGRPLAYPIDGCIVVFTRKGGGHVGFCVGTNMAGDLLILGGNQSDAVNIRAFPRARVTGYRWPLAVPVPSLVPSGLTLAEAARSVTEA